MRAIVFVALLGACTKAGEGSSSGRGSPPAPPPSPKATADAAPEGDVPEGEGCAKYIGPRTTFVQRIGKYGRILPLENGFVWQANNPGVFNVFNFDWQAVESVERRLVPGQLLTISDDSYFVWGYDVGGPGPHGDNRSIIRIDRKTNKSAGKIAGPSSEIHFAEVIGEFLYWGTFGPYGSTGEFKRVPTMGGKTEVLWSGRAVESVLIDHGTAYVSDGASITAVPLNGRKPVVLADNRHGAIGLAVDTRYVYFTERGTPDGPADGSVSKVPIGGGKVEQLAGPLRWPSRVAVDDERIYFMSDGAGEVWAIPKSGGTASVYIPTAPDDYPCRDTRWMYAGPSGLKYVRASPASIGGTLWGLPRDAMKDPQQHFRDSNAARSPTP